jgi:hypothetical protein
MLSPDDLQSLMPFTETVGAVIDAGGRQVAQTTQSRPC